MSMVWRDTARQRARERLAAARRRPVVPPFTAAPELGGATTRVTLMERAATVDDGVPRVPLALPLAALVFLGGFIPVIGATLTGAVAVLVALVTVEPVKALIVLGVVIAVQQLEGHVLQPVIMGRAVALHPMAVILSIATGVLVAGIIGGLVAVPLLAVVNTAVRYLVGQPDGEPTPDREPPGTVGADGPEPVRGPDGDQKDEPVLPPMETSVTGSGDHPAVAPAGAER